jgi:PAS domain S-box-containing protein
MKEKREKYLELLLENSPDIIFLLDQGGRILYCSRIFLALTGTADFDPIKGRTFEELYERFGETSFLVQSRERFRQLKAGQKTAAGNVHIVFSALGKPRNYSIKSVPIYGGGGNFDGALMFYHDLTDLFRAEEDERIRAMFDAIPLACTFWDADGNVVDCNQEALKLFKVSGKEEFCRRFSDFSPPFQEDGSFSRNKIKENFWKTYKGGDIKFPWIHRSADGEWLPCFVNLVRIKYREAYRVVGYTRDLRDIRELEDKRREADARNRELEIQTRAAKVASEEKSKFLASMSHEIRTPMNAIIGMSELMRIDNLDETQKSFFTDIRKMSKALLQIINDILDISKIEAGRMELVPVHFNLSELYDNICSLNRFSAEAKDLEFRQFMDPRLPRVIYGDDVRIRQVLTNLLNNAIKYTAEGYVEFRVERFLGRDTEDSLVFSVRDTGIGIRKEDFPKLFGNFQQLDSSANRGIMGTGLGLAITKNLVAMMGGEIVFDSEYGKGSVFTVFLPLAEGDPEKVARKRLKSRVIAADNASVLVVDDNKINLKVALAFLAAHNITADTAQSGSEALDRVSAQNYDIVFMDQMMPGMDGIEAVRRIRALSEEKGLERLKGMPIIALSANAVSGAREFFLAAGMDDFISKPIDAADLNQKLSRWLPAEKIRRFEEFRDAGFRDTTVVDQGGAGSSGVPEKPAGSSGGAEVLNQIDGLNNMGNEQELYRRLCTVFHQDHRDDHTKIRDALAGNDLKLAHRLAHTLKSTAGLIGGKKLSRTALAVEKALAAGNDNLHTELDRLGGDLGELLAQLEETGLAAPTENAAADAAETAGTSAETRDGPSGRPAGTPAEIQVFIALCGRLEPLLKAGSTGSFAFLDDIKTIILPLDGGGKHLVQQIDDFEFTAALKTLRALRRRVEGKNGPGR